MKSHEVEVLRGLIDEELRLAAIHLREAAKRPQAYRTSGGLKRQCNDLAHQLRRDAKKIAAASRELDRTVLPLTEGDLSFKEWLKGRAGR